MSASDALVRQRKKIGNAPLFSKHLYKTIDVTPKRRQDPDNSRVMGSSLPDDEQWWWPPTPQAALIPFRQREFSSELFLVMHMCACS